VTEHFAAAPQSIVMSHRTVAAGLPTVETSAAVYRSTLRNIPPTLKKFNLQQRDMFRHVKEIIFTVVSTYVSWCNSP
jgi:hypothetical protein